MSEALSVIEMVGMQHENQYGHGTRLKFTQKEKGI